MDITETESKLLEQYSSIIGIDEAGRGPWAGPVVVVAFKLDKTAIAVEGVKDSKKTTLRQRLRIFGELKSKSKFKVACVNNQEIDRVGIKNATEHAILVLIGAYQNTNPYFIVDGIFNIEIPNIKMRNKADNEFYSVACASILAKVTRDKMMDKFAEEFPEYSFERHKGYGTMLHEQAIKQYGLCRIHRRSFKPIQTIEQNLAS